MKTMFESVHACKVIANIAMIQIFTSCFYVQNKKRKYDF